VERKGDERLLVIAKDRVEALTDALGKMKILASLSGTHHSHLNSGTGS
jgi:hypothetical protein